MEFGISYSLSGLRLVLPITDYRSPATGYGSSGNLTGAFLRVER